MAVMQVDPPAALTPRVRVRPYQHFRGKVSDILDEMATYTMKRWRVASGGGTKTAYAVDATLSIPGQQPVSGSYSSVTMYHGEIDALSRYAPQAMQHGATLTTDTNPCKRCAVILCLYNCLIANEHLPKNPKLAVIIPVGDTKHFHSGYQGAYEITDAQGEALARWVGRQAGMTDSELNTHQKAILADFKALSGTT
jgi:hypothetical protein